MRGPHVRALGLALALAALMAACGGATETDGGAATAAQEAAGEAGALEADTPAADAAFPVVVEHKFGATEIAEEPERVVALGFTDQDALLALGVTPVAVRYWYGDEPHAVFPWAQDALGDAEPEVLEMPFGELDYEAVAALEPDLISAVYAGLTEEEHARLSQLAPTIAQASGYVDFGMPWQEMTVMVGRAVGRAQEAGRLVAEVEGRFAEARAAHPEWTGRSVAVASGPKVDGQYHVYGPEDARARVFAELGFEIPDELAEIAGEAFYGTISAEQVALLERDLVAFHQMAFVDGGRAGIEDDALLGRLDAMADGRVVYVEGELDDAFQFSTVLSLPYLLDGIVPLIEDALEGSA